VGSEVASHLLGGDERFENIIFIIEASALLTIPSAFLVAAIPRVSQFLALSPVRGPRGHAGDVWVVDLGV
jgi:hypothetical protein